MNGKKIIGFALVGYAIWQMLQGGASLPEIPTPGNGLPNVPGQPQPQTPQNF